MTGHRLAFNPLYQFFVANPDEELTIDDVAAKFGVGRRAAGMLIYRLQRHGALEYVRVARLEGSVREGRIEALEAKIDALMLEYCPDEMSAEQKANWAAHQRPVAADSLETK